MAWIPRTDKVSFYEKLIEDTVKGKLTSGPDYQSFLLPPVVKTAITSEELSGSKSALGLLFAHGADRNLLNGLIIDVIQVVMDEYNKIHPGKRHSGIVERLGEEIFKITSENNFKKIEVLRNTIALQKSIADLERNMLSMNYQDLLSRNSALNKEFEIIEASKGTRAEDAITVKKIIESGVVGARFNDQGNYANLCRALIHKLDVIEDWKFSTEFKSALNEHSYDAGLVAATTQSEAAAMRAASAAAAARLGLPPAPAALGAAADAAAMRAAAVKEYEESFEKMKEATETARSCQGSAEDKVAKWKDAKTAFGKMEKAFLDRVQAGEWKGSEVGFGEIYSIIGEYKKKIEGGLSVATVEASKIYDDLKQSYSVAYDKAISSRSPAESVPEFRVALTVIDIMIKSRPSEVLDKIKQQIIENIDVAEKKIKQIEFAKISAESTIAEARECKGPPDAIVAKWRDAVAAVADYKLIAENRKGAVADLAAIEDSSILLEQTNRNLSSAITVAYKENIDNRNFAKAAAPPIYIEKIITSIRDENTKSIVGVRNKIVFFNDDSATLFYDFLDRLEDLNLQIYSGKNPGVYISSEEFRIGFIKAKEYFITRIDNLKDDDVKEELTSAIKLIERALSADEIDEPTPSKGPSVS